MGRGCPEQHLQRIAAAPVEDAEIEQLGAPPAAHGAEVVQRDARDPPQPSGQLEVRDPRVQRPRAARRRDPTAEHEVALAVADRVDHAGEERGIHRRVGVAERHERRGRGLEPRMRGSAEPAARLPHHEGAVRARHLGGAVGGSVVDDDRAVPLGQAGEDPGQGLLLVEAGEDHVHERWRHPSSLGGRACARPPRDRSSRRRAAATRGVTARSQAGHPRGRAQGPRIV